MSRRERKKLSIPFGEGLDRATGPTRTDPSRFEDLRNVLLFEGRALVRKGYERTGRIIDNLGADMELVVQLHALRAEAAAMGVGFNDGNKELHLNLMAIDGTSQSHVASADTNGRLFALAGSATFDPPVVHMVDSANKMFIAHDEPLISARNTTRIYDPTQAPVIQDLEADLDDDGTAAPVKFRGVTRHLSYLVGWGYGHEAEQDRPDIVRVSLAGDPDLFDPRHFFKAGQRSEPVLVCRTAGNLLLVFKETETYEIFGYSPETFGIRPADSLFGCVGSRLAVSVADTVFFWSVQGPRMSGGGESVDLAIPLDIGGPDPATLVAESDPEQAFATYDPETRAVLFVWGRRVYALSIRQPQRLRWSYYELGANAEPYCSGQFFQTLATGGGGAAPTGWPVIQDGSTVLNDESIEFTVFNNGGGGANGNEVIEVWVRDQTAGGGPGGATGWSKHGELNIDLTAGGPNFSQTFTVGSGGVGAALKKLNRYEVSLRYRGGGQFAAGFTDANPALWNDPACPACPDDPPAYRDTLTTTVGAPEIVTRAASDGNNGLWERTGPAAEQITITHSLPANTAHLQIRVARRRLTVGNLATQNINGIGRPPDADVETEARTLQTTQPAGATDYVDTSITGEEFHDYDLQFENGDGDLSAIGSVVRCHAGPDPPTSINADCSIGAFSVEVSWANSNSPSASRVCPPQGATGHTTEVWENNETTDPGGDWVLCETEPPGFSITVCTPSPVPSTNDDIRVAARHKTTCSGVDDYSQWAQGGFDNCQVFGP